jgi:hypothetical protein
MATVNLGRIKPVFRGAYNNSTAYVIDDIVTSGNETFIAIAATQGNATTDASKWTKLAAKGADGTDVGAILANKEIAFKTNAGAVDGIPIGTAGQALKVNSGATGYEFGTAGGVLQVKTANSTATHSFGSSGGMISGVAVSITPSSASNKILVMAQATGSSSGTTTGNVQLRRATGSSVATSDTVIGGGASSGSRSQAIGWMGTYYQHWNGTNLGFHFLDAPNTTSQITYGLMMGSHDGGTYYIGRTERDSDNSDHGRFPTNLTLMEIASGVL